MNYLALILACFACARLGAATPPTHTRLADGQRADYPVKWIVDCPSTNAPCDTEDDCALLMANRANPLIGAEFYMGSSKRSVDEEAVDGGGAKKQRRRNARRASSFAKRSTGGTGHYSYFAAGTNTHLSADFIDVTGPDATSAYYCDRTVGATAEARGQCKLRQYEATSCNTDAQCLSLQCNNGKCQACSATERGFAKSGGDVGALGGHCRKVDRFMYQAADLCDDGLYCDTDADYTCQTKLAEFAKCDKNRIASFDAWGDAQCAEGTLCRQKFSVTDDFTCEKPRVANDWCFVTDVLAFKSWYTTFFSRDDDDDGGAILVGANIDAYLDYSPCPADHACYNGTSTTERACLPALNEGDDCFDSSSYHSAQGAFWPYKLAPGHGNGGCKPGLFCNSSLKCEAEKKVGDACTDDTLLNLAGSEPVHECSVTDGGVGKCLQHAAEEPFNASLAVCAASIPAGYDTPCNNDLSANGGCAEGSRCGYDSSKGYSVCLEVAPHSAPCSSKEHCGFNYSESARGSGFCSDGWCMAMGSVGPYERCDSGFNDINYYLLPVQNPTCAAGSICVSSHMWPPLGSLFAYDDNAYYCVPLSDVRSTSRGVLEGHVDELMRSVHTAQNGVGDFDDLLCQQSGKSIESVAESHMLLYSQTCYDFFTTTPLLFPDEAKNPGKYDSVRIVVEGGGDQLAPYKSVADLPSNVTSVYAALTCCQECHLGSLLVRDKISPIGVDCDTLTLFDVPPDCCGTSCSLRNCGAFVSNEVGGTILKDFEDVVAAVGDGAVEASDLDSAGFVREEPDDSLSGGIIALIVIIVLVVLILIAVGIALLVSKLKDKDGGGSGGGSTAAATSKDTEMKEEPASPRSKKESMAGPSSPRGKNPDRGGQIGGTAAAETPATVESVDTPDAAPATEEAAAPAAEEAAAPAAEEAPTADGDAETKPATPATEAELATPDLPPQENVAQ